jgi:hypothetical protein
MRELEPFKGHLTEELTKLMNTLVSCDDPRQLAVLQGRAQQLKSLVDLIESSNAVLDRIKSRNPAALRSTLG